jgi:hypothetical protein
MGGRQSKKTPLQCTLDTFKRGYTGDHGVELTLQKFWKFCQIDWVSFEVGWPSEESPDVETIPRVYQAVTGMPGHPNQLPCIDIWQTLAAHPLAWLKKCFEDNCKIMSARTTNTWTIKRKEKSKKVPPPVLQAEPDLFSPPYDPVYLPVPWPPPPLVDSTTDSEPEDSGDLSSPPSSGVSTSPPAQSGAHLKTHLTAQVASQMPFRETRGPM